MQCLVHLVPCTPCALSCPYVDFFFVSVTQSCLVLDHLVLLCFVQFVCCVICCLFAMLATGGGGNHGENGGRMAGDRGQKR